MSDPGIWWGRRRDRIFIGPKMGFDGFLCGAWQCLNIIGPSKAARNIGKGGAVCAVLFFVYVNGIEHFGLF